MIVWQQFRTLAIVISAGWFLSEILLGVITHSRSDNSEKQDKSSLRLLWFTIIPCMFVGVYLGARGIGYIAAASFVVSMAGLVLVVLGLAVRWTTILTLKGLFTSDVNVRDGHRLIDKGVYSIIRHPAYAGSLLTFLGFGMTFSNWLSTLVVFIPILFAFLYRIRIEERALLGFFGTAYHDYCRKTKRLIPKIY